MSCTGPFPPSAAGRCWSRWPARRGPGRGTVERFTSLPFVVVGVTRGDATNAGSTCATCRHPRATPSSRPSRRTSRRTHRCDHPGAIAARPGATRSTTDWWPSRPPIRCCSRGRSSRPGEPAVRRPGRTDDAPRVRVEREGDTLVVTLTRPDRLNALDARMRDELVEALTVAAADASITASSCAARDVPSVPGAI